MTELEALIRLSETTGIKFATVSGDLDLTTDPGRLIGRILGAVARGEIERKSARQKAAAKQAADAGRCLLAAPSDTRRTAHHTLRKHRR